MNIKIKSSGVSCLIGDDYDRVYATLRKQLGEGDEQLFTERIPGHEYLQWELPGTGWTSLAESDPLMSQEVRNELIRRQKAINDRFGSNQDMAQRILTVPDDTYVYYKADENGHLVIRLTAWGYRYPERIGGGTATTQRVIKNPTEHVTVKLLYDGNPMPGKAFKVNGFMRATDTSGTFDVGDLPIGYQMDVDVDGQSQHVTVMPGQGEIVIDATLFTTVEVYALFDNNPYAGANGNVSYMGHNIPFTTDGSGKATVRVPIDPNGNPCSVSIDSETQQRTLVGNATTFQFYFKTPEPPTPPTPEVTEEPVPPAPPVEETPPETPPMAPEVPPMPPVVEEPAIPVEPPMPPMPPAPPSSSASVGTIILMILGILLLVAGTYTGCAFLFL